ncbi:putative choline transporter, neither null mutation nor overexpression affects choline transport [Actinomortierella ambigua]|nr:putative choline transporter, neither null mutation nor overexpression affects choline transport [Actinomortierella ambigua]
MSEYHHLSDKPPLYPQQQHPIPYGVRPPPTYQPHQQQGQWGHDQGIQQYPYSGTLPPPQTVWNSHPPQQPGNPEYELSSIGHQAPSGGTGVPESQKQEKFQLGKKINDLWALFAFLIEMVGYIVLSAFAISNIVKVGIVKTGEVDIVEKDFFLSTDVMVTFALGISVSVMYSYLYLLLTHMFPLWTMPGTYWFIMLVLYGFAGFYIYSQNYITAGLFLGFAIVFTYTYLNARERIRASTVVANIVHVTISGVFATHYFQPGTGSQTMANLKRACTTSFGTVCFGGLIYAILMTIKKVINQALEFLTPLVYSEVAIYGKPFIPAAKDVYRILKNRGLDILLNNIIISTVWGIGTFFGAFVAAIGSQYYLIMTMGGEGSPNLKGHGLEIWVVTFIILFLGIHVISTAGAIIKSGVATIFVALAEDPDTLARTKPEFFAKIKEVYPQIVERVQ